MAPSNVVLLLIGLHGTGKSTFAKAATGQDVKVNPTGGVDAYTKECNKYTVDFKQRRFIIIDTPGMADQNTIEENLDVLQQVADQLQNLDQERVNGVIYFHSIEGARLSGVDRDNIRILKKICGDEFFPRVAFVTTRWDRIRRSEWDPILVPRNRDLETERMKLLPNGPSIFRFLNDGESHKAVLDYFAGLEDGTAANRGDKKARRSGTGSSTSSSMAGAPQLPPQLLFAKELERYRRSWDHGGSPERTIKRTTAGKELVARTPNVRKGICAFL